MKTFSRYPIVLFFMILLVLPGCYFQKPLHTVVEETQAQVDQAREDFEAVKTLEIQTKYPKDFSEAEGNLQEAEEALKKLEGISDPGLLQIPDVRLLSYSAQRNAQQSRAASQRMLRQYYLEIVVPIVAVAEKKLDSLLQEDAEHPLEEFKPVIEELSIKVERVKRGEEILTLTEVIEDINTLIQTQATLESNIQQTIQSSDIVFEKGEFELSEEGQHILEEIIDRIVATRKDFSKQYPGKTITIQLTTVGYADELDFNWTSENLEMLLKDVTRKLPPYTTERRKFLNLLLSEFRARVVNEYLTQHLLQIEPRAHIKQESIGRGEKIPPGIAPPYPTEDPRRRICKIYSYIMLQ